ncbi:unnamed protein product [Lactuca virosa]|uniref:Myb/SANT-like domain-containing protein n=1 Tax=Lactuca virosa TaxID=75947 RepID=A0AAU9M351_9ASTR|nr:unnamed protein product [Lactuca virosa]
MAGRSKHTWTTEEDTKLIEALLELHVSGKYGGADNGFKPGYLKAVQQLLDSHKGAACFRDKPFPQFDNLCKIFGKDRATSNGATGLGEEDVTEETQRNSLVDVEGLEDIVEETQQIARVNSKCKRPPTDDAESSYKEAAKEMKVTFKEVGEKLIETIYNIGKQENKEACDIIDKVVEDIQRMPNINVIQRIKAIDIFSKDQFRARAFFKMTEEEKICYMEMIADGSIS